MSNGKTLSDADQAFIARIRKLLQDEGGKAISDADQKNFEMLMRETGADQAKVYKNLPKSGREGIAGRLRKQGGPVKKYAKGGGVRKARYK